MSEIAIVLNTKERNDILVDVLKYYQSSGFKGSIYIGNASSISSFNKLNTFITDIKEFKIKHIHYPKCPQQKV